MLSELSRRLMVNVLAIFLLVLLVFSLSVYAFVLQRSYDQVKSELSIVADSAISSIDFDETVRHDAGQPDVISSVIPDSSVTSLSQLRLQWYDSHGQLSAERGNLAVELPFNANADFQIQDNPHAMLLTRKAVTGGTLLGHVRVAKPLAQLDAHMQELIWGLLLGTSIALIASAFGGWWLLQISLRPTENMIARLRQFVADAAHELRSPLMVVKTNCETAMYFLDDKSGKQGQKLETIQNATEQMISLTEDLLSLNNAETLPKTAADAPVNVVEIVRDCICTIRELEQFSGIELRTDLPELLSVVGRPEHLRSLCANVLENAFRYTPAPGRVSVSGLIDQQVVKLTIEDSGIGIAPEDLPKVFDRFWRADKARSYRDGGNGLGLAIANSIAIRHGGSVVVTSKLGKGSKFVITLPAASNSA